MADLFNDFLADPSAATFAALRDVLIKDPAYDFYATDIDDLDDLAERQDHQGVVSSFPAFMPNWLLSPRVHALVSRAAEQVGDKELATRERYLTEACLRAMLASGDGSELRPYPVTHVPDEYDLLEALDKEMARQRQHADEVSLCDVIECTDGSEIWFDISPSLNNIPQG